MNGREELVADRSLLLAGDCHGYSGAVYKQVLKATPEKA